jgi:uncharacterized membrane protein YdjX (TVP38/TMEM64 family)
VRRVDPRLRLAALVALLAAAAIVLVGSGSLSAHRVRGWLDGYGAAGPLVFVAVSSLLTVALFPGPLLAGASGLLFGTALGTPVSIVAATTGAALAFAISRWWAGDAVERLAHGRLLRIEAAVSRRGFLSVLYLRIAPGVPYNLVNYGAGLTRIRPAAFVGATAIGVAPRAFAYTALGGSFGDLGSPETIAAIAVLVVMALAGLWLARRDIKAAAPGRGSWSRAGRSAGPR